jgi:hypothetical protein
MPYLELPGNRGPRLLLMRTRFASGQKTVSDPVACVPLWPVATHGLHAEGGLILSQWLTLG